MRYSRLIAASALIFAFCTAKAQNYDPTVEVTKDFVSEMADAQKLELKPTIPDSLTRFNLNFDYEVFSKPYKGSYNFTPYNVMLIPDDAGMKRPYLYLNAGAGYGLHPVLTAVVSPRLGRRFTLDLYQDLAGYSGAYEGYSGYDLTETAGVRGSLRQDSFDFLFDFHYNGIAVRDTVLTGGMFHRFGGSVRLSSSDMAANWMSYDVCASYNLSRETAGLIPITESEFLLYGTLAPSLQYENLQFLLGFNTGYRGAFGVRDTALYSIETNPMFRFDAGKFHFRVGAVLSYLSSSLEHAMHLYPDLRVDVRLFKDRLNLYAGVKGGDRINSYSSIKATNHHFSMLYVDPGLDERLCCTREYYNAFAGLGGSIGSLFQYNLVAGRSKIGFDPMLAADKWGNAYYVLEDYNLNYIDASTSVATDPVDFSLGLHFRQTDMINVTALDLPVLSSDASLVWNWHRRFFVGASFEMATARESEVYTIDPFYNLGLSFEMKTSDWLSVWLRADNLLNQRIERIPGIVERGIGNGVYFSAGLRMDLR